MVNQSKPVMTLAEREVFNFITKEKLNQKEIGKRRKCSRQAIYKILKGLRNKGFLPPFYKPTNKKAIWFVGDINKKDFAYSDYCYFCDSREKLEKHHIIKVNDGGLDEKDNLLLLCKNCHKKVHTKFILMFSKGYYIMINKEDPLDRRLPNMRHMNLLRDFPKKSLNKAVNLGKLKINK